MTVAGVNGYIHGVSSDTRTKATQLWQFIGTKIFFRLSCLSRNQSICKKCGTHTEFPFAFPCTKPEKYDLSEYPIRNIFSDGYTYNYSKLKGCHKFVL